MKLERRTRERKVARASLLTSTLFIPVLVCAVLSFFFFSTPQKGQITLPIIVGNTSDAVVAGACTQTGNPANCSLRGAIEQANVGSSNSVIRFGIPASDPFCSAGVCTINLTQALPAITEPASIVGPGADLLTVRRSSGGEYRVFTVTATGTVNISGITVSNGNTSSDGGGISNGAGTLNVANSTISNNFAPIFGDGTGIFNNGGTLNVTNSTISNNVSGNGPGFSGNGGGIFSNGGTVNVTNSTISGNSAKSGGGICSSGGILNVTNSTITNNSATIGDSGMNGGGILNGGIANVRSSIIALNTATTSAPDVLGNFASAGFNLIGKRDGSTGFTIAATDQTGTIASPLNPMLEPGGPRNNGGPTRTIALLVGSPAIDKGASNGLTGNLTTDQRGTGFPRIFDNPAIPNAAGGNGADIGAFERQSKPPADFDGDRKTDIGIFRPNAAAEWWINRSSTGVTFALQFGASSDRIVPADYSGDGKADIAFFRPVSGEWYVLRSEDFSFFALPFGVNGDIPVSADYDADGKADFAVFRPSSATWFISRSSGSPTQIIQFGINGDQPVVADYDADGKADVGIIRAAAGGAEWWIQRTTSGLLAMQFGANTDKAVQGDYTGDGKADVAMWRPSTGEWFIVRSENFSFFGFPFGSNGDVVAPGDYDGDGKFDATVFRPSSATWFVQRSTAGTQIVQFGVNGDRPIPNAFVP